MLKNIIFLPYQPRFRLPEILASADVSLVSIYSGLSSESIPSKTYPIMASGRPVLAIVDKNSDIWKLIDISHAGICIEPNDANIISETIQYLERSPRKCNALGWNGREYVSNYHSRKTAAERFNLLIMELGGAGE